MGAHEHSGNFTLARQPIEDFVNWSDNNEMIHLPTRGAKFAWNNGRSGRWHTKRRLDRTVVNKNLLDICSPISFSTLTKIRSDHYPFLLDLKTDNTKFSSSFKFQKMWSLHNGCKQLIVDCWNNHIIGCHMFVLHSNLKLLKMKLKQWNKDVFGNIHSNVEQDENKLADIQNQINIHGHNDNLMNKEKIAQISLDQALNQQETFWKEKARVNWHVNGDRNTNFFP